MAIPFGVLACDTLAQAKARAGGRGRNKGGEAMDAALALVALPQAIRAKTARASRRASTKAPRSTS